MFVFWPWYLIDLMSAYMSGGLMIKYQDLRINVFLYREFKCRL